jgi:hypothetical protein
MISYKTLDDFDNKWLTFVMIMALEIIMMWVIIKILLLSQKYVGHNIKLFDKLQVNLR